MADPSFKIETVGTTVESPCKVAWEGFDSVVSMEVDRALAAATWPPLCKIRVPSDWVWRYRRKMAEFGCGLKRGGGQPRIPM